MKKTITSIIVAMFAAGCSTPTEIRSNGSTLSTSSTKSAKAVTACISGKWKEAPFFSRFTGSVNTDIQGNGYSITAYGKNLFGTWPVLIAEISETQTGCDIQYYTTHPAVAESYYLDSITQCR